MLSIIRRLYDLLEGLLTFLGALSLGVMMALTTADVVMRYLFSRPIIGAMELTQLLMAVLIFTALPAVSRRDGHVTVDLFDALIPHRARDWRDRVVHLIGAVLLGHAGWYTWIRAERVVRDGDITASLHIPMGPFTMLMAVMLFATAIVHVLRAIGLSRDSYRRERYGQ